MAYKIEYLDVVKAQYEKFDWIREDIDESLKGMEIINVESLKECIRFWYKREN